MGQNEIDVERSYSPRQTAVKLRRIADAIEDGRHFRLQVAGHRLSIPPFAEVEIEMQADDGSGEIEIEIKWNRKERQKRRSRNGA